MKKIILTIALSIAVLCVMFCFNKKSNLLPVVAIANYGPLKDLQISIEGIEEELQNQGFKNGENIKIIVADIAFDHSLIPQVITKLKNIKPKVMVVMATPIAQFAAGQIREIPLVFHAITDPVAAQLLKSNNESNGNVTGSSDMQDLTVLLKFAKTIFPRAKTIGMLNLTSDINDAFLIEKMQETAPKFGLSVAQIPIEHVRGIPIRIQQFKNKVDFIYIGASGLHSAMPVISSAANKMHIPVLDTEDQSVRKGLALASFGVNYKSVGRNAGKLVAELLKGKKVSELKPIFPQNKDHECFINKHLAKRFKIQIPPKATIVGE